MNLLKRKVECSQEEGITIAYREWTKQFEDIENYILGSGKQITAYGKNKEMVKLRIEEILYFEAVGDLVFAYTKEQMYEMKMRLYKLEDSLRMCGIKRASKSALLNLRQIISVRPALNGRLYAKMSNGEEVLISRQYAKEVTMEIMSA
ncbi:MAG: LytTR family DNA-binding domain-containing protein [Lachnospiraceae bacterium]|nr:LytTR family DNA-binding domain-containing protein [Lachnospiraceae bacterium]